MQHKTQRPVPFEITHATRDALQARLAPARLTHCMRWLGQERRAHDVAHDYACRHHAFGKLLAEREGMGFMLADNDTDLHGAPMNVRAS